MSDWGSSDIQMVKYKQHRRGMVLKHDEGIKWG